MFSNNNPPPMPRSKQKSTFRRVIDAERWRDRWCWRRKRKGEVTGTHVQGREEMTATGSLHSSFPLFSSVLTSRLWQLTCRHESDGDILWPLPCLTHYFDTSCPDGMSGFMLTNLERPLLYCAQSLFKLFRQGRRQEGLLTCEDYGVKSKRPKG